MTKIYVIRQSGGEWSDSWTSNICAKYNLEEAEQFIKESSITDEKARKDYEVLQREEDKWEEENDYEYEEQIPLFTLDSENDKQKVEELKVINEEINKRNASRHEEFYKALELHMEKFAKDNNLTRGGSEYSDTYHTIDEIDLT